MEQMRKKPKTAGYVRFLENKDGTKRLSQALTEPEQGLLGK